MHFTSGPAPGERVAPVAGAVAVGAGRVPRFALFANADAASARLLARFPELLEPAARAPLSRGGAWLVRPDGYLACAAADDEIDAVGQYLDGLLARRSAG
jgi:hypothetical protein